MKQKQLDNIISKSDINEAGLSRRDFLKLAGLAGAIALGADYLPAQAQDLAPSKPAGSQSGIESKVVNKPDLKVGDTWVLYFPYNGKTDTRTIKDIKNGLVYRTQDNDCGRETFVYTLELGLVEGCGFNRFSPAGRSDIKVSLDPPQRHMPFPVRAGDTWSLPYKVYGAGLPVENWIEGKALGWETIQVPAGTFEALKIEAGRAAGGVSTKYFFWYGHAANGIIKYTNPSAPHFDYELQSYKRA